MPKLRDQNDKSDQGGKDDEGDKTVKQNHYGRTIHPLYPRLRRAPSAPHHSALNHSAKFPSPSRDFLWLSLHNYLPSPPLSSIPTLPIILRRMILSINCSAILTAEYTAFALISGGEDSATRHTSAHSGKGKTCMSSCEARKASKRSHRLQFLVIATGRPSA
jgi:hypothetical protein